MKSNGHVFTALALGFLIGALFVMLVSPVAAPAAPERSPHRVGSYIIVWLRTEDSATAISCWVARYPVGSIPGIWACG